jgi:hypothetical protein
MLTYFAKQANILVARYFCTRETATTPAAVTAPYKPIARHVT